MTQVPQPSVTLKSSCCPEATSVFLLANSPQAILATSQQHVSAPAITLDREPFALRSTRNRLIPYGGLAVKGVAGTA